MNLKFVPLIGLVLSWSAAAVASETAAPRENRAAAEALFEEGVRLMDEGRFTEACAKLEASDAFDSAVGTLLYLGDCYERSGRLASAWARFREARSLARQQGQTSREAIAKTRSDALEPRLSWLIINVNRKLPGFELRLAGKIVPEASWGSALPIDPGLQLLEATAPGHLPSAQTVRVPRHDGARLTVEVQPLRERPKLADGSSAPAAADPATRSAGNGWRIVGVTVGSVGLLSLAGGGVLALIASSRNEESLDHCPARETLCSARGVKLREDAGRFADLATLSAGVGGGLLATGVVLYVTAPRARRERVAISLVPDFTVPGAALRARGEW
jgi:hypothetical protein